MQEGVSNQLRALANSYRCSFMGGGGGGGGGEAHHLWVTSGIVKIGCDSTGTTESSARLPMPWLYFQPKMSQLVTSEVLQTLGGRGHPPTPPILTPM